MSMNVINKIKICRVCIFKKATFTPKHSVIKIKWIEAEIACIKRSGNTISLFCCVPRRSFLITYIKNQKLKIPSAKAIKWVEANCFYLWDRWKKSRFSKKSLHEFCTCHQFFSSFFKHYSVILLICSKWKHEKADVYLNEMIIFWISHHILIFNYVCSWNLSKTFIEQISMTVYTFIWLEISI